MLKYISKGKGRVLLLLHGYKSSKESFLNQINFFSRYYRVLAVDLTGFGENKKMKKVYSLDDYILDLINFFIYTPPLAEQNAHRRNNLSKNNYDIYEHKTEKQTH